MSRRRIVVVVSQAEDAEGLPRELVAIADDYIAGGDAAQGRVRIVNLCRAVSYGSDGYYVSLLADARGHDVLPRLETSAGLSDPYTLFRALQEAGVPTLEVGEPGDAAEFTLCLGVADDARFHRLGAQVFDVWPAPLLRVRAVRDDGYWKVAGVTHASPALLTASQRQVLSQQLSELPRRNGQRDGRRDAVRASLAVLVDAADPFSASSPETIERLERVAARMHVHVARIGASELHRLPEYDALFIRSLTGVTLPSFQFALRAEALDMPVLDDSQSIMRCGNKVYVDELMSREGVPLPRTVIVTAHTPWERLEELGLPFVMKLPDGSFSAAVHRIGTREDYETRTRELLSRSPLLIAQEWLPTPFDWRVTVLDGRVLFAARYYMAQGHWQIRSEENGVERYGKVEAVPRSQAPKAVVDVALRAASLIGRGLYGVDIKDSPRGPVVIEVNDNPNLDADYEDVADGDVIYEDIIEYFLRRIAEADTAEGAPSVRAVEATGSASRRGVVPPAAVARRPGAVRRRRTRPYRLYEVAGLELEYPTVNADLDVVALVEPAFRAIAGRGTSDIELDRVGFSNEIADHVFEVKTLEPLATLSDAEDAIVGGIRRFAEVLDQEWDARLLPTGMHPWFDPQQARLWTRSGLRIYTTYAQIFDIRTHGWMNVHATHLNLPFGDERETMAMHTAAAMVLPYLPAIAASSPIHDGRIQDAVNARLAWIVRHQSAIPQTCGRIVPEPVDSFAAYRREILQPMYDALDAFPHSAPLRHEFLNARGAVLRFARRALELRVLDTQECVHMDVAMAVFARAAMRRLTRELLEGRITAPSQDTLIADFAACVRDGSAACVAAPHLRGDGPDRADAPFFDVRAALLRLLDGARDAVDADDAHYLDVVAGIIAQGSLAERIRDALLPFAGDEVAFGAAMRRVYGELAECLVRNEPWTGRAEARAGDGLVAVEAVDSVVEGA